MQVISVCSGVGTDAVAWHPLGWEHLCFAEIEKFPSAVLKHRWPHVPNEGDFTKIGDKYRGAADLLVGGTPCQSFSVAGLRGGLADDRGNLALEFLRLADRTRPRWVVWENVPGVLSSNEGRDFGTFLGGLGQLGYGWAYRILDAQYFGVPQRRRRVFVVGHLGDWRAAAAVLFERHSLQGDHPPRRKTREGFTRGVEIGPSGGGFTDLSPTLDARCKDGFIRNQLGVGAVEVSGAVSSKWAKGTGGPAGDECYNLIPIGQAVAFAQNTRDEVREMPYAGALAAEPGMKQQSYIRTGMAVRRLTPRECERLQGLPDDYTLIPFNNKPAADGPRYKAIGNGMAVPVVQWIGKRIMDFGAGERSR